MGLYVITEGTVSYNDDLLLEAELSDQEFKEFDAFMKSDQDFDLDGEIQQTHENTEKRVRDIEKKMITSCKRCIESFESAEKQLPFLERIKHKLENSLSMCEERINKVRNKKYDNESFTTKIKDQAIKFFNIIKKGIMKVLNAIVNLIIKVKNSIFKK